MAKTEYLYSGLSSMPSEKHLRIYADKSVIANKVFEISRNDSEKWMKIWTDPELSSSDKECLDKCVADSIGKNKRDYVSGSEYFELVLESKKWIRCRRRVVFDRVFSSVPTVSTSNVIFDGTAGLTIIVTTTKYFDFVVESRATRQLDGLTMVSFDWEAIV